MRSMFAVIASVAALLTAGAGHAACGPGDLSGLYEGEADVPGGGKVDVVLNVACAPEGYKARLITGMGEFQVSGVVVADGKLRFALDTGASLGTVELAATPTGLSGAFKVVEDSGAMRLVRKGDAVAPALLDPTPTSPRPSGARICATSPPSCPGGTPTPSSP